jgi:hypothetical protein
MTAAQSPSAMLNVIPEGVFMTDTQHYLIKTLIQRGESDTYILQRLLLAGLQDDEAYYLIRQTRQSTEATHPHVMSESEGVFLLIGIFGLLVFIAWLIIIQV